jgi:hypothetical protein
MMMEYIQVTPSEILDEAGAPTSIEVKCIGRELISVEMAKEKFPHSKKKNGKPGQFDHLDIRPGVILTMEQGPQPVRRPPAQPQQPQIMQ